MGTKNILLFLKQSKR